MGRYINETSNGRVGTSAIEKSKSIVNDGAVQIPAPDHFVPNLVCIVDNGPFAAAAYVYDMREFKDFNDPNDPRPKRWFTWNKVEQFAH